MASPLERFESSSIGRTIISAAILVVLVAVVVTHLPPSPLRRATDDPARQLLHAVGLEQQWAVFAPDPRRVSLELEARVTYADGSRQVWTPPAGSPWFENLRFYRWRKWMERVRQDDHRGIWEPTARWIADEHERPGNPVVRVELVRRFRDNVVDGPQPEWQEAVFYRFDPRDEGA